jgi:phosphonate transport system substrate-binding protein
MKQLKRIWLVALMLCLSTVAYGAEKEKQYKELNFGIIATESTAGLKEGFGPFLEILEKKIGMKINPFFAPDYAGIIEAMRFDKVQVAWYGNKSAIEAVDRADGEVFAQTTGADGSLGYYSLIIVHQDSPYKTLEDIIAAGKDLTFGNGDPNSTSGYLIPSYYIWSKRGIDPNSAFKRTRNANHEANCLAVASKQVDFATNNTESMDRFEKSNPDMWKNIRIVWTSPMIPTDPLVWRKDLPRELKSKIAAAVLEFGRGADSEQELKILAGVSGGWGKFLVSDNTQLLPIRELEIAKEINKLKNSTEQNQQEKEARLTALTKEQSSLEQHIKLTNYWNTTK